MLIKGGEPSAFCTTLRVAIGLRRVHSFHARKLQTAEPSRLAKVGRDVIWYQQRGPANTAGLQLLRRGTSELSAWLVAQRGIGRARAGRRMWGTVEGTVSPITGRSHSWATSRNGVRKRLPNTNTARGGSVTGGSVARDNRAQD